MNKEKRYLKLGKIVYETLEKIEKGEYPGRYVIVPIPFLDGMTKITFDNCPTKVEFTTEFKKDGSFSRKPLHFVWRAANRMWSKK